MATRAQQEASADRKAARTAALKALDGEPLPLPTEPRQAPAEPSDELPAEIVALGACGLTDTQIANHLALTENEMRAMGKACSAVADALSRARTASKAWWEEQARRALITENNRFPAGAWAQVMKARFSEYEDKGTTVHIDLGSLVVIQRQAPQLTADQSATTHSPLIEGRSVRLGHGPTAQGSPETNLSGDPTSSSDPHQGDPGAGEGG